MHSKCIEVKCEYDLIHTSDSNNLVTLVSSEPEQVCSRGRRLPTASAYKRRHSLTMMLPTAKVPRVLQTRQPLVAPLYSRTYGQRLKDRRLRTHWLFVV